MTLVPKPKVAFDPVTPHAEALEAKLAALPKALKPVAPTPPPPTTLDVFRLFRNFAAGAVRRLELEKLFPDAPARIESLLKQSGKDASLFGEADGKGIAKRLFTYLADLGIRAKTKREFLDSSQGYVSNVAGELVEWIINADKRLRKDILQWAAAEAADLNRVAEQLRPLSPAQRAAATERIVDGTGKPIDLPPVGRFDAPARATDIWLETADGGVRKFVDAMDVSLFRGPAGEPTHMSPVTLGQFKFRTAVRKAARQMAEDPGRLADAVLLHFTVGGTKYSLPPERIAFLFADGAPRANQYLVTNAELLATPSKSSPAYANAVDDLLGAARPQVTPISRAVNTSRGPVRVNGVMVELNLESRLVLDIARIVFGP
jgi:hypothetical protein